MKNQEMFDVIWDRVVVQKIGPSVNEDTLSMYRGPNGNKCFAGVFIPDNLYTPEMEGKQISTLISDFAELYSIFEDRSFARDLQFVHDNTFDTIQCKARLELLAKTYNLKLPGIKYASNNTNTYSRT